MTYEEFVLTTGMTQEELDKSVYLDNVIEPTILSNFEIKSSSVEGLGYFTTIELCADTYIGPAFIRGMRTELGRFVNHSDKPNIRFIRSGDGIGVVTLKSVNRDEELLADYADNWLISRDAIKATGMNKMELYLRNFPQNKEFEVDTKVFDKTGVAVRYLKADKGDVVLGKVHKVWNVNILAEGSMWVTNDPEKDFVLIKAPYMFETGPGSQKFVMCATACTFMNVLRSEPGETEEEVVNRMAEDTEITRRLECQ